MSQGNCALVAATGGLLIAGLMSAVAPSPAAACGGLFCNSSQPVNQAAERILFVDNGDGTTTAAIQIQYQGPAERFAWVLPVPDIENPDEDITVSSDLALERLQQATNPLYMLTTRIEGDCGGPRAMAGSASQAVTPTAAPGLAPAPTMEPAVVVQASGSVGPFDWELLEVNAGDDDAAQVAVDWLTNNEYEIGDLGADLLRPYLDLDNKLLAVRLTKGNEAGAIRPLMIRYAGDKPSIPIRPTAVAANPDMGVMVWVGGKSRSIAKNYSTLELNETLINWFAPNTTYNDVVTAAADEAGGHGFVTEYAERTNMLANTILRPGENQNWTSFSNQSFADPIQMFNRASQLFGTWDGFREAFTAAITIPAEADFDIMDVLGCLPCYLNTDPQMADAPRAQLDTDEFRLKLFELVVRPMLETEALLQSQPWVTRMYTTMSAEDMNEDPVFDFNPDLEAYSNRHTRERVIECNPARGMGGSPWRVEFGDGIMVRGQARTWPVDMATTDMPATLRILQAGTSGAGTIMIDNVDNIRDVLGVSGDDASGPGDSGGPMAAGAAAPPPAGTTPPPRGGRDMPDTGDSASPRDDEGSSGPGEGPLPDGGDGDGGGLFCSVSRPGQGGLGASFALGCLAIGGLALVRRARRAR